MMGLFTLSIVLLAAALGWLVWRVAQYFFVASPLDKIPGPKPGSIVNGNLGQLLHRHAGNLVDELGCKYQKVVKLTGPFRSRVLYVFDPLALYHIIVKDADTYVLSEINVDENQLTLGHNLMSIQKEEHRRERKIMNPAFSIKNMRALTPVFYNVVRKTRSALLAEVGDGPTTVDILNWLTRTALELVGQGALGYSLDSLDRAGRNEYGDNLKAFLPVLFEQSQIRFLLKYVRHIGTPAFRAAAIDWLPFPRLRRLKEVVIKMDVEARRIYYEKKRHLQSKDTSMQLEVDVEDNDIISSLIRDNIIASGKDHLTDEEIIGQMSFLAVAGTDTTSSGLTQILQLLVRYPDIQEKLRSEIEQAQVEHGDDIPYNVLVKLPYMDAICRESLRLYPPVPVLFRETCKDIVLPLSEPVTTSDGSTMAEIQVPAGTMLLLGSETINRSKDVWGEDALEFKPERWLSPLPSTVTEARIPGVYSYLMTFSGGPRSCIGFKFSQLEMKVVLTVLLSTFNFSFAEESHDVIWNFAAVRYPTIGKVCTMPEFPLVVERLEV